MTRDTPDFRYTHVNGHFDPLVLATFETQEDPDSAELRSKLDVLHREYGHREALDVGDADFLARLRKLGNREGFDVGDSDFLTYLTNKHEQDHFARHASCELGLFVTLLLQLRFYTAMTAELDPRPRSQEIGRMLHRLLGRLVEILISGREATQAVVRASVAEFREKCNGQFGSVIAWAMKCWLKKELGGGL